LNLTYDLEDYIPTYMLPKYQYLIDENVNSLINNNQNNDIIDMSDFYESNEFDVMY